MPCDTFWSVNVCRSRGHEGDSSYSCLAPYRKLFFVLDGCRIVTDDPKSTTIVSTCPLRLMLFRIRPNVPVKQNYGRKVPTCSLDQSENFWKFSNIRYPRKRLSVQRHDMYEGAGRTSTLWLFTGWIRTPWKPSQHRVCPVGKQRLLLGGIYETDCPQEGSCL